MKPIFIELTTTILNISLTVPINNFTISNIDEGSCLECITCDNYSINVQETPEEIMKKISDYVIFIKK
jgi:hypothetical protein